MLLTKELFFLNLEYITNSVSDFYILLNICNLPITGNNAKKIIIRVNKLYFTILKLFVGCVLLAS